MLVLSLCNGDPEKPILQEGDEETILKNWESGEVMAVYSKCAELALIDEKELEAELGNSNSQQDEDSNSG